MTTLEAKATDGRNEVIREIESDLLTIDCGLSARQMIWDAITHGANDYSDGTADAALHHVLEPMRGAMHSINEKLETGDIRRK
jgi:hypothetical protein